MVPERDDEQAGQCERCGQEGVCRWVLDPFISEGISDPEPDDDAGGYAWWCEACEESRRDDV